MHIFMGKVIFPLTNHLHIDVYTGCMQGKTMGHEFTYRLAICHTKPQPPTSKHHMYFFFSTIRRKITLYVGFHILCPHGAHRLTHVRLSACLFDYPPHVLRSLYVVRHVLSSIWKSSLRQS